MIDLSPLFASDRSEPPTERRLREAAREGRGPDAAPLARPAALLAGLLVLRCCLPGALARLAEGSRVWLRAASEGVLPQAPEAFWTVARLAGPLALAAAGAGLAVRAALGSSLWAPARLSWDAGRVLRFDASAAWAPANVLANLAWSFVKVVLILAAGWKAAGGRAAFERVLAASPVSAFDGSLHVLVWMALAWLAAGAAECALGRLCFLRSLRMTPREVLEDLRQAEGDPLVKRRIREEMECRLLRATARAARDGNCR